MRSAPSPEEEQDAEWRELRRANYRRLLMFPLMVALGVFTWLIWTFATCVT